MDYLRSSAPAVTAGAKAIHRRPPVAAAILLVLAVFHATSAYARHPEIASELGSARMLGASAYRFLTVPVFDAELWSDQQRFSWDAAFALSLTYRRDFDRDALISRTLSGMAERAQITSREALSERLRTCFSDVRAGDRFTGVSTGADSARFYLNGRRTCEITWPGFSRSFFGIWLDARGGDRAFSERLRGGA